MSELLEAALEYRRKGFSPIPLRPGEKAFPALKTWRHLQTEPWTEEQIREYWTRNPEANIGLHPAEQNFIAIDVDSYKGVEVQQDFAQLCVEYNINYQECPTVTSPSGGTHIYMALNEKVSGNRDILGNRYIDTRSTGNFILAPPSRDKQGKQYKWVEGKSIFDNPIMPLAPKRFVTALQNDSRKLAPKDVAGQVIELNADFKQTDGREALMASIVFWIGMEFARKTNAPPTTAEWIQLAWPEYIAQVAARGGKTLDDDQRGVEMMMSKISSTTRKISTMLKNGEPLDDPDFKKEGLMEIELTEPIEPKDQTITASNYQLTGGQDIPPRQWLYGSHYIRKFLSCTVSPGGLGKSQLAIAEALSMATGKDLLRKQTPLLDKYKVWYFNVEDPIEELARRVEATAMHYGIEQADIEDRLLIDSGRDQKLVIARENAGQIVKVSAVYDSLLGQINEYGIDCLIVDPFIHTYAGISENDNNAIGEVIDMYKALADDGNCSIEMIHHSRKLGGVEATAEDSRGASALVNAARSVRALNRVPKEALERVGVDEDHRRYFYYGAGDKANLAPPPAESNTWRRLVSVDLGNATLEYPDGDQIGVVTGFEPPDAFDGITSWHLKQVQTAIAKGDERVRKSNQSEFFFGYLVAEICGLEMGSKVQRARVQQVIKQWVKNKAITEGETKTSNRKIVAAYEVGQWAE